MVVIKISGVHFFMCRDNIFEFVNSSIENNNTTHFISHRCSIIIYMWVSIVSLTHWSRVTHICVSKLSILGSDNGLSPGRRQAIIWTNAGILLIGPLGTNFSEILIEINTFSFKKLLLKTSSAKWRPFCLGLNELRSATYFNLLAQKLINLDVCPDWCVYM